MKRRTWIVFSLGLLVAAGFGLTRPGPALKVPGFTDGWAHRSVYNDRGIPARGGRAGVPGKGWSQHTLFSFRDHPWRESVDRFGALVEARGFARVKGVAMPMWRRGDEMVSISGMTEGKPPRMTRTSSVGYSRSATIGDVLLGRLRGEIEP